MMYHINEIPDAKQELNVLDELKRSLSKNWTSYNSFQKMIKNKNLIKKVFLMDRQLHIRKLEAILVSLDILIQHVIGTPNSYHEYQKLEDLKDSFTSKMEMLQMITNYELENEDE